MRAGPAATARVQRLYDRAAPGYTHYRDTWLAVAGDAAEAAMLADLARTLRSGQRVLDAGSGTGAISRRIRRLRADVTLTMLDLSTGMLDQAADVGAARVNGNIVELPFPDGTFDVVVSAWVIETAPDPRQVVTELLRVLAPGGQLLYTFCSQPIGWPARASSLVLRAIVRWAFAGRFLDRKRTPWHDCATSHRNRFHHGLTTEIALGKCCTVGDADLPSAGEDLERQVAAVTLAEREGEPQPGNHVDEFGSGQGHRPARAAAPHPQSTVRRGRGWRHRGRTTKGPRASRRSPGRRSSPAE